MPKILDPVSAVNFAMSAIEMLSGPDAAKKLAKSVEKFFKSARKTAGAAAGAASGGKAVPVITWVRVVVYDADAPEGEQPAQVEYSRRTIVDAGPHKRVPIASGGGYTSCQRHRVGPKTVVTVCTEITY